MVDGAGEWIEIAGDSLVIVGVILAGLLWLVRSVQSQGTSSMAIRLAELRAEFDDHLTAFDEHCRYHHPEGDRHARPPEP
jgi:hypothetical protein